MWAAEGRGGAGARAVEGAGDARRRGDLAWGTVPGLVRAAAERFAGVEAVVDGRTRVSYAELGARVEAHYGDDVLGRHQVGP